MALRRGLVFTLPIVVACALPGTPPGQGQAAEREGEVGVEYELQLEHVKVVAALGEKLYGGFLDADGLFVTTQELSTIGLSFPFQGLVYYRSPARGDEPVYEYRSGLLLKGKLNLDHDFVPEAGSNVIALKEYRPGKGVPRIYNLPGRLVPKAKAGDKRPDGG